AGLVRPVRPARDVGLGALDKCPDVVLSGVAMLACGYEPFFDVHLPGVKGRLSVRGHISLTLLVQKSYPPRHGTPHRYRSRPARLTASLGDGSGGDQGGSQPVERPGPARAGRAL